MKNKIPIIVAFVAVIVGLTAVIKLTSDVSAELTIGLVSLTFGLTAIMWTLKARNRLSVGSSLRRYTTNFVFCLILTAKFINNFFIKADRLEFNKEYYVNFQTVLKNKTALPEIDFTRDEKGNYIIKKPKTLDLEAINLIKNNYRNEKINLFTNIFNLSLLAPFLGGVIYTIIRFSFAKK